MTTLEQEAIKYSKKVYEGVTKSTPFIDCMCHGGKRAFIEGADWQKRQMVWVCTDAQLPPEHTPVVCEYSTFKYGPIVLWRECEEWYSNFECDIEFKVNKPDRWKPI